MVLSSLHTVIQVSCSFVFIVRVCERLQPTVSFCFILCFRPFQLIRLIDNIFCFYFYQCGEFGHLSAFCSKSSDSSKANPRLDRLDEG